MGAISARHRLYLRFVSRLRRVTLWLGKTLCEHGCRPIATFTCKHIDLLPHFRVETMLMERAGSGVSARARPKVTSCARRLSTRTRRAALRSAAASARTRTLLAAAACQRASPRRLRASSACSARCRARSSRSRPTSCARYALTLQFLPRRACSTGVPRAGVDVRTRLQAHSDQDQVSLVLPGRSTALKTRMPGQYCTNLTHDKRANLFRPSQTTTHSSRHSPTGAA